MTDASKIDDEQADDFDAGFANATGSALADAPAAAAAVTADEDVVDEEASVGDDTAAVAEQGQTATDEEDPLKDASEPVRKLVADLRSRAEQESIGRQAAEHSARSNAGRVAALTRKVDSLQKSPRTEGPGGDAPGGDDDNADKSFGRDYPEVDGHVRKTVEAAVEPLREKLAEKEAAEAEDIRLRRVAAEISRLHQAHPDFGQIKVSPEYGTWLAGQAPKVREMASSENADDAITLCNLFKASRPQKPAGNGRDRLVEAATQITSKGAARVAGIHPDDFDAGFEVQAKRLKPS